MEEQYISGEEYQEIQRNRPAPPERSKFMKLPVVAGILAVVIILVFVGGWFSGVHYQKGKDVNLSFAGKQTTTSSSSVNSSICVGNEPCGGSTNGPMITQSTGGGGGPSACQQTVEANGTVQKLCGGSPITGTVTAITPTSVSVQPSSGGSIGVIAITSSTTIQDNGATVTYGDIKIGDTVGIIPSSTNATQAIEIMVNPKITESGSGGPVTAGN